MTTENPDAVALLAEALNRADYRLVDSWSVGYEPPDRLAAALLAHPRLARVVALGLAWVRAEEALPEGYNLMVREGERAGEHIGIVNAWHHDGRKRSWQVEGPDAPAALIALAEKIGGSK